MQDPGWVYSLESVGFRCCRDVTRQAPPRVVRVRRDSESSAHLVLSRCQVLS